LIHPRLRDERRECGVLEGYGGVVCSLFEPDGRPLLVVDNLAFTDEGRIHFFQHAWPSMFALYSAVLRERPIPTGDEQVPSSVGIERAREAGYFGDTKHSLVIPLFEPAGLFGGVFCGGRVPFVEDLRQSLMVVGHQVSVRLAQLGLRSHPSSLDQLTQRQFEVGQLAARGNSNAEIGAALDMSENTVKKHLKDIFERLAVANRAELASRFASSPPREDVPIGITHRGSVTIMRFQ
jgi:DNA-binding CsgD family transcriptional regulator